MKNTLLLILALFTFTLQAQQKTFTIEGAQYTLTEVQTIQGIKMYQGDNISLTEVGNTTQGVMITESGFKEVKNGKIYDLPKENLENFCQVVEAPHSDTPKFNFSSPTDEGCLEVDLFILNDYKAHALYGNDLLARNVAIVNNMNLIYQSAFEKEVRFNIVGQHTIKDSTHQFWSPSVVYSANSLLQAHKIWADTSLHVPEGADLYTMWTGNTFAGQTVGIAYVGTVCQNNGFNYSVVRHYTSNIALESVLLAHELGHNLGFGHDGTGTNFVMSPSVSNTTTFSDLSKSVFTSNLQADKYNCFDNCESTQGTLNITLASPSTNICPNSTLEFTASSNLSITEYAWAFGTQTATTPTATFTFNSTGVKMIQLTAKLSNGQILSKSISITVTFKPVPNADFTYTIQGTNVIVNTTPQSGVTKRIEINGTVYEGTTAVHPIGQESTFFILSRAENECGQDTKNETITFPPIADFSIPSTICQDQPLILVNTSWGVNLTYRWIIDGTVYTTKEPTVTFQTPGEKAVTLEVQNSIGSDSRTKVITVQAKPQGDLEVAVFDLTAEFSTNSPNTVLWNFGDGTTSTQKSPVHIYEKDGNYNVSLKLTSSCGSTTETQTVQVGRLPNSEFSAPDTVCLNDIVTFNILEDPDRYTSSNWKKDQLQKSGTPVAFPFNELGSSTVRLFLTNGLGSDVTSHTIITIDKPLADFDVVQVQDTLKLINLSKDFVKVVWKVNDSIVNNTIFVAPTSGEYKITLEVENDCGTSTLSQTFLVIISSIEEEDFRTTIFPNPTTGLVNVGDNVKTVRVYDTAGKLVYTLGDVTKINLQNLPSGIYRIQITNKQNTIKYYNVYKY